MTYSDTYKENLASRLPTFLTSNVFVEEYLTGQVEKLTWSGKSSKARAPMALTGTTNFSRSVMQISSCT